MLNIKNKFIFKAFMRCVHSQIKYLNLTLMEMDELSKYKEYLNKALMLIKNNLDKKFKPLKEKIEQAISIQDYQLSLKMTLPIALISISSSSKKASVSTLRYHALYWKQ